MTLLGNTRLVVACVVLSIVLISHHAAADEYCEATSHDSASAWRQCALGEEEAADDREGGMLQRGGAKKAKRMAKKGKSAKKAKGKAKKATKSTVLSARGQVRQSMAKFVKSSESFCGAWTSSSKTLVPPLSIVKQKALQEAGGLLGILEGKHPGAKKGRRGRGAMRMGAMRMQYSKIPKGGGCIQANLINHCIPAGLQVGKNAEVQRKNDLHSKRGWFDKDTHKQYHIFCDKSNSATVHKSILTAPGRGNTPPFPKSVLSSRYTPLGATEMIEFTRRHSVGNVLSTLTCKDPDDVRLCSVKVCKKVLESEVSNSYQDPTTFWYKVKNRQLSRNRQLLARRSQWRRRFSQRRRRSSQRRTKSSQQHWTSVSGIQFAVQCGKRWVARVCSPMNRAADSHLQCVSTKTCDGPVKIGIRQLWNSMKSVKDGSGGYLQHKTSRGNKPGWEKFAGRNMWEESNPRVKFWLDKFRSEEFSKRLLKQMTEMQCANDCALF